MAHPSARFCGKARAGPNTAQAERAQHPKQRQTVPRARRIFLGKCPLGPCLNTLPEALGAGNELSSVEAELGHDGDRVLRQVAAPGSAGPLGGALAPLLRELVDAGAWPCGQLAQHELAPRRNSGKLLLVPD